VSIGVLVHMISDISPLLLSLRGPECRGNLGGASGGVFRFPSPPIHQDCFASLAKTGDIWDCFVAGAPRKDRMGFPGLLCGVYPEPEILRYTQGFGLPEWHKAKGSQWHSSHYRPLILLIVTPCKRHPSIWTRSLSGKGHWWTPQLLWCSFISQGKGENNQCDREVFQRSAAPR